MDSIPQRHPYHSQLRPPVDAPAAERFTLGESVVFRHDVAEGLPVEYDDCDVLYSELPWRNGMSVFNERAGASITYKDFLGAVSVIALISEVPLILVTGKHALTRLPDPRQVLTLSLNGDSAVAVIYGARTKPANTATEIITRMANGFSRVGDFCCGYGRTLRIFHQAGKTFVGSDYNARCVGYIAQHAGEW